MYPYDPEYLEAVGTIFLLATVLSVGWALFRAVI